MNILGVSAFYHDSAAALVRDGLIVAAAQEERFTRRRHDAGFPAHAIRYCLAAGSLQPAQVDRVVFYEKPFPKFERLLETYLAFAPRGFTSFRSALPVWISGKLFQKRLLRRALAQLDAGFASLPVWFAEHHVSHAASAFFASPFAKAAILTLDGVGEWTTTSTGVGEGNRISLDREIHFPHSLGLLYSAFTYYTGFRVNSGEYKVMGLAPYGEPCYAQAILDHLIDLKPDGSFRLNLEYFDYCTGLRMTNSRFDELLGGPARRPSEPLTKRHMDLAASVQEVINEAILRLTRSLAASTGMKQLCMAGGVALNCVANGKVLRDGRFDNLWIQPAAGDAGGALGAALAAWHIQEARARATPDGCDLMQGAYLGPSFTQDEIERQLTAVGAGFAVLDEAALLARTVGAIESGKAVGWFQGRMEFGPRALGARSILGDARSPSMQSLLNRKVKFRESFRPFAPSVLREHAAEWFALDADSPYMLLVADVLPCHRLAPTPGEEALSGIDRLRARRSAIPAVTHVDHSARVQTVHRETNPLFYALLERFYERTRVPILVNTSFNVRGEPIVCTPTDAYRCFRRTGIDVLAIGRCFLGKTGDEAPAEFTAEFPPD